MSLIRYLTKLLTYISTDKRSLTEGKNYIPTYMDKYSKASCDSDFAEVRCPVLYKLYIFKSRDTERKPLKQGHLRVSNHSPK